MNKLLIIIFLCALNNLFSQPVGKGVEPVKPKSESEGGDAYAIIVGVSKYDDPAIPKLRFAHKDAMAYAEYLMSAPGGSLDSNHIQLLINHEATRANFAMAIVEIQDRIKAGDRVYIYFSGHGDVEKRSSEGYLLCSDATSRAYNIGGSYALDQLQKDITWFTTNDVKVTMVTDACRSGNLAGAIAGGSAITLNMRNQYSNEIKILSCQANELSYEDTIWGGGRGAFSYHLINGLYGMADADLDSVVTLKEIEDYLDNKVSAEVAPNEQTPITVGNKRTKLVTVDEAVLARRKAGTQNQIVMFASLSEGMKGFGDDFLSKIDSSGKVLYAKFKEALKNKVLLDPKGACADTYYEQIMANPQFASQQKSIRRQYAAELQNDAQKSINIWLTADVQELESIGKEIHLEPIPRLLDRAAELVGPENYFYQPLRARKILFEGILLASSTNSTNALQVGRQSIDLFKQSLVLESNSPLAWREMADVYLRNLRNIDSAFYCARQAQSLSPKWVLPYVDISYILAVYQEYDLSERALQAAEAMDANHPFVINRRAALYNLQGDKDKALLLFEKYRGSDGVMYPSWYNNYGQTLIDLGRFKEAETALNEGLALDSTKSYLWGSRAKLRFLQGRYLDSEKDYLRSLAINNQNEENWNNLGVLYYGLRRYDEAVSAQKKAIAINSKFASAWSSLGATFGKMDRLAEAETAHQMAIELDPNDPANWNSLGKMYMEHGMNAKAEAPLKKAIEINSKFANPYRHLGKVYYHTGKTAEAEKLLRKSLELNPLYSPALLDLAAINFDNSEKGAAFDYLEQAVKIGVKQKAMDEEDDLAKLRKTREWRDFVEKHFNPEQRD